MMKNRFSFILTILTISFIFVNLIIQQTFAEDSSAQAEMVKVIEVQGKGDGKSARASDDAIQDALRKAVEQAVGVYVQSDTLTENYKLVYDKILTNAKGFVKEYKKIREWTDDDFTHILINAKVSLGDIREDNSAISLIYELVGSPRIMVIGSEKINENKTDTDLVQIALEEALKTKNFTLIDKSQIEQVKTRDVEINLDDYDKAAALGKRLNADIVINYKANVDYSGKQDISGISFDRYKTIITARMVASDSAELLGTAEITHSGGAAGNEAAKTTLSQASKKIPDIVIDKLLKGWKNCPNRVELFVKVTDWQEASNLMKSLKKIRFVSKVTEPSMTKNIAYFQITGFIKGPALATKLSELEKSKLKIINVSPNRIDAEIVK